MSGKNKGEDELYFIKNYNIDPMKKVIEFLEIELIAVMENSVVGISNVQEADEAFKDLRSLKALLAMSLTGLEGELTRLFTEKEKQAA